MSEPPPENQQGKRTGIPLGVWFGSDATDRLRQTILDLDKSTKRQTTVLIWLTVAFVVLTLVLVLLTIVLVDAE